MLMGKYLLWMEDGWEGSLIKKSTKNSRKDTQEFMSKKGRVIFNINYKDERKNRNPERY